MTTFSLQWTVSAVQHTKDFASRRNIKKQVIFPRYQGSVSELDTVLAYVGSKEVDPTSNLSVIRREDSLLENSRTAFSNQLSWNGNTGYTSARYFLLTDVVGDYVSTEPEPFYWKHSLPDPSINPDSVAILNKDLQPVDSNSYTTIRIEARDSSDIVIPDTYERCEVFSNYLNSVDDETGEVNLYFVRYVVSGSTHYQILNPEVVFTEAVPDDISMVTGSIKPWRKVYLVSTGASIFTITTPSISTDYYLIPQERSRIVVREPTDRSDERPWFVNVSNGSFSSFLGTVQFAYSIPEFSSQTFSPLYPYKIEVEEVAEYIRPDILKLDRSPLQVDSSLYKMEVIIRNAQNQVLYALTTETAQDGEFYEESGERVLRTIETENSFVTWDANGIVGWDAEGSFVHLKEEYPDIYYFYVTYYYEERGFEYTALNANPIFDEGYNGQFHVLYIIPDGGSNGSSISVALQHLKVDRSGRIVEASQDGSGGNLDIASTINIGEQYMYYSRHAETTGSGTISQGYITLDDYSNFPDSGIVTFLSGLGREYYPYSSKSDNKLNLQTGYALADTVPAGTTFRLHSFVTPYSTASTANNYQWLVLAEIHAASTSRVDELSIIDLRKPGGVVKDKYKTQALAIDPRAVWARPEVIASKGQPTPGNSVAVVKLPYTLLKEYGGDFTREQVEAVVTERHLATGVVPAVIFHGAIPNIISLVSTTSSVSVAWDSEGSEYSYNIYYSSTSSGPWTLANSSPFEDQIYGNTYTVSGLTSGLIYYVTVASVDANGIESPKGDAWGIKTRNS